MTSDTALYNRSGKSVLRLCECTFYDYEGRPRGFLVGRTVYDMRGQHRGFYFNRVVRDRMGKVIGYAEGALSNGIDFPFPDIPPVPYKNLAAPEVPDELDEKDCPNCPPVWSIMRLENLLV